MYTPAVTGWVDTGSAATDARRPTTDARRPTTDARRPTPDARRPTTDDRFFTSAFVQRRASQSIHPGLSTSSSPPHPASFQTLLPPHPLQKQIVSSRTNQAKTTAATSDVLAYRRGRATVQRARIFSRFFGTESKTSKIEPRCRFVLSRIDGRHGESRAHG